MNFWMFPYILFGRAKKDFAFMVVWVARNLAVCIRRAGSDGLCFLTGSGDI